MTRRPGSSCGYPPDPVSVRRPGSTAGRRPARTGPILTRLSRVGPTNGVGPCRAAGRGPLRVGVAGGLADAAGSRPGAGHRTIPRSATAGRRRNRGGSWGSGRAEPWVPRGGGRTARRWRHTGVWAQWAVAPEHAAADGRQDGGDPSNRGRAVTRRQRGMPLAPDAGPSHAPPPPGAGGIVAGPVGAPDVRNRGSHAAPAGRQDSGDPAADEYRRLLAAAARGGGRAARRRRPLESGRAHHAPSAWDAPGAGRHAH